MNEVYSVSELAELAKVTQRAVRLYVERGLLAPLRAGSTLCFTPADVEALKSILRAKRLGFSLEEIKSRQDNPSTTIANDWAARVRQIQEDVEHELADLNRHQKHRS